MEAKPAEASQSLTPRTIWISLAIATAVPFLMLAAILILMIGLDYNILNWME